MNQFFIYFEDDYTPILSIKDIVGVYDNHNGIKTLETPKGKVLKTLMDSNIPLYGNQKGNSYVISYTKPGEDIYHLKLIKERIEKLKNILQDV